MSLPKTVPVESHDLNKFNQMIFNPRAIKGRIYQDQNQRMLFLNINTFIK